jgi:redox-sensitive bicupin YhaK (pirin superfamily)
VSIRIVSGEINVKDATTRVVLPTVTTPRCPPFARVAETIAAPRRRFPPHRHESVEVLTYVIEGSGSYESGSAPATNLMAGSTSLLTATESVAHSLNPKTGQTLRWFGVIVNLPAGTKGPGHVQSSEARPSAPQADGTVVRRLVGPESGVTSATGLESEVIEFQSAGTAFRRVGHDRVAIFYALSGNGQIDSLPLDAGEAALAQDASGVAVQGRAGLRLVSVSAPRTEKPT